MCRATRSGSEPADIFPGSIGRRARRSLDDGLRDDPKTQHRVGDHQHEHRNLAVYGEARIAKTTERDDVGQRDRRDVTDDDRDQRRIPNESSANDADIGSKARSAKNVPSESKRIGREADQQLSLDQEVAQVVSDEIRNGDRHQRQDERATCRIRRHPVPGIARDPCHHHPVEGGEQAAKGEEPEGIDDGQPRITQRRQRHVHRVLNALPERSRHQAVERQRGQHDDDEYGKGVADVFGVK